MHDLRDELLGGPDAAEIISALIVKPAYVPNFFSVSFMRIGDRTAKVGNRTCTPRFESCARKSLSTARSKLASNVEKSPFGNTTRSSVSPPT